VVVGIAPVVEELTYRGLGFFLLRPYGEVAAIVGVGVAFGLAHGLVEGLPILSLFGMGLAFLRSRTDSIYPPILLHAAFNGFALAVSLTF
jgi:membrane protease YdiL (CAAX protease family)